MKLTLSSRLSVVMKDDGIWSNLYLKFYNFGLGKVILKIKHCLCNSDNFQHMGINEKIGI